MKIHPSDLLLEEFLADSQGDYAKVAEHLTICSTCRQKIANLLAMSSASSRPGWTGSRARDLDYDSVFARTQYRWEYLWTAYEAERDGAKRLFSELMTHPPVRQEWILSHHPRFQTWGLLEYLLDESREEACRDALRSEQLASLALKLCDGLDHRYYGAAQIEDLRARSCSLIGNARRIRTDLDAAEEAFDAAFRHLRQGTGEPLEKGMLLDLNASLLRAHRRFGEATRTLQRAVSGFLAIGDRHRAARSLVNLSTVYEQAGDPDQAITSLERASPWIDGAKEPCLMLNLNHNLVTNLTSVGRILEAQRLFCKTRPLYQRLPTLSVEGRRSWVQARIARALGQESQAEHLLDSARRAFEFQGSSFDTALVSLELGSIYARQGRSHELRKVGHEMISLFASLHIDREMHTAMELLQ